MDDARASGAALFDQLAAAFDGDPGVGLGRMFSTEGLAIRGKIFAFAVHTGDLVVKLPEARIDELGLAHMVMRDRPMREWAIVPYAAGLDAWRGRAEEALAFVAAITP